MKVLKEPKAVIELLLGANKSFNKKICAIHQCHDLQEDEIIYRVSESNIEMMKALDGMVDTVQLIWHRQGGLTETGKALLIANGIDFLKYFDNGKLLNNINVSVFAPNEKRK